MLPQQHIIMAMLIALLSYGKSGDARTVPTALDSTDRVTYVYDGPPVMFGPVNEAVEIDVPDLYSLNDVDVKVTIMHSYTSDVTLRLGNPQNQSIVLVRDVGSVGDNFIDTEFDDAAAASIVQGAAPFTGSFRPIDALSLFNGGTGTGRWILYLEDAYPAADNGILNSFELTLGGRVGGVIYGSVTSLSAQEPLSGVRLEYAGTPYSTLTDDNGDYILTSPEGTFDLLISYPFWCSVEQEAITLALYDTMEYNFQLAKPAADLSNSSFSLLVSEFDSARAGLTINNPGNCPLEWSAVSDAEWLSLSSPNGTVSAGGQETIDLIVDASMLEIEDYLTTVTVTHNAQGSPELLPVFVRVLPSAATATAQLAPSKFRLIGCQPNPFNLSTSITFAIPHGCNVQLTVYNALGQRIAMLIDDRLSPGRQNVFWNGIDDAGQEVAAGMYLCRLSAGGFVDTKKMLLLK